jgi:competence CoiA-like predicted nuclease
MTRKIVSYALEITWNDGQKEIRRDFPNIEYVNEYLNEIEEEQMTKEEMIEMLIEHDLNCFYEQSYKHQEATLRNIFFEEYINSTKDDLKDLCIDYGLLHVSS